MKIDERGRTAGAALRSSTTQDLPVAAHYEQLITTARRHHRLRVAAVAAAVATLIGGAGYALANAPRDADLAPTDQPPATSTPPQSDCDSPYLRCTAGGRITMQMPVPVSWTVGPQFDREPQALVDSGTSQVYLGENYQRDATAGVTVAEGVQPVRATSQAEPASGVPADARSVAQWVADRPFLDASAVQHTTVDGVDAWTVRAATRDPSRQGVARCNGGRFTCMPLLSLTKFPADTLGVWDTMISQYTFVDLPGAGVTMIWSWSFDGERSFVANQQVVDSIRFK
ncbi:MAG TPA: hypothetical protein VH419_09960 [Nocardioidaceae bacterium]